MYKRQAIYVATPNTLHYENCKLCLEQGKHVLCEKPFTISPEQAQELYRLAEEKHLFLMEAFWIWLLPLYDRLRQILTAGTIGAVSYTHLSITKARLRCHISWLADELFRLAGEKLPYLTCAA